MESNHSSVEVLVIGSGIGGLSAAKTYLELQPSTDLLILEQRKSLGGVWAYENCYEGLKTNNLSGTYEWPDFPMEAEKYGVKVGGHIPGMAMHKYMVDFSKHFGLYERIEFRSTVLEVEKMSDKSWNVTIETAAADDSKSIRVINCTKLIVASGLASKPNPITLPGQEHFGRPIMNQGKLRTEGQAAADDPNVKSVTIIGASKSGYDAVFLMASHGKKVDWIIRKSGGGASAMAPPWIPLPGRGMVMIEHAATMRYYTWMSPCIWGNYDGFGWIRSFFHGTRIGRWLTYHFWEKLRLDGVAGNGYREDDSIKHLEPDEGLFWTSRVGIHNYTTKDGSIHEYVKSGQVKITKDDITELAPNGTINLAGGGQISTDCLIQTTGWSLLPSVKYSPAGIEAQIGVPHIPKDEAEVRFWSELDRRADQEILRRFPALQNPPKKVLPYKYDETPLRMYRGIAPPGLTVEGDNSIAFIKMVHSTSNFLIAEVQSLWAFAYLQNKLPIDRDRVFWSTALTSRYGKVRYPCGFPHEFIWDVVPYADMLLTDLGLRRWRKNTWTSEIFDGYVVQDYKGINREWKQKFVSAA